MIQAERFHIIFLSVIFEFDHVQTTTKINSWSRFTQNITYSTNIIGMRIVRTCFVYKRNWDCLKPQHHREDSSICKQHNIDVCLFNCLTNQKITYLFRIC